MLDGLCNTNKRTQKSRYLMFSLQPIPLLGRPTKNAYDRSSIGGFFLPAALHAADWHAAGNDSFQIRSTLIFKIGCKPEADPGRFRWLVPRRWISSLFPPEARGSRQADDDGKTNTLFFRQEPLLSLRAKEIRIPDFALRSQRGLLNGGGEGGTRHAAFKGCHHL